MSGSATPYLRPDESVYGPQLAGQDLVVFLQGWIVGITGLPGELVSVSYQPEPINVPEASVPVWCAVGITRKTGDTFPYVGRTAGGEDAVLRHERFELRLSFYGLGIGSAADATAEMMRDGIAVEWNRYPLTRAGFGVVSVGDVVAAPVLLKERWQYRADLTVEMSREIRRAYPVPSIAKVVGTVTGQPPSGPVLTEPFVGEPSPD